MCKPKAGWSRCIARKTYVISSVGEEERGIGSPGGENGLLYEGDGDFSRKIRIKSLEETTQGMAQT